jgi:hypothetical protein
MVLVVSPKVFFAMGSYNGGQMKVAQIDVHPFTILYVTFDTWNVKHINLQILEISQGLLSALVVHTW